MKFNVFNVFNILHTFPEFSASRAASCFLTLSALMFTAQAQALTASASPSTCTSVTGIGTAAWSNAGRARTNNNSYATATVDGTTSNYLRCTGYNFALPAGAIINGISVNVKRRANSTSNGGIVDAAVRLVKASVIGTTDRSTATVYGTTAVTEAHGGAADLWGDTWLYTDINAAGFGVAFAASKPNAAGTALTASVDWIEVVVTYTMPTVIAQFAEADPTSCSSLTGSGGNAAWSNSGNATASDNASATTPTLGNGSLASRTTQYLQCLGYNFNIPANATITGITVTVERKSSASGSRDFRMRAVKGGVIGTTDRSTVTNYTTADVMEAHGSATDLWGTTWTPAQINAANFGAAFAARKQNAGSASQRVSVDLMRIRVDYTIPGGPDHILITHTGNGLTCSPQYVTLTACADAACTMLYTVGGLNVTVYPGGQTFTIGTSGINSAATVQQATVGPATLSAISSPAAGNPTTCMNSLTGSTNCTNAMQFSDSGFLITAPDHVSCTDASVLIEAVRRDNSSIRCIPAYANVTRPVSLSMAYSNPAGGTRVIRDVNNGSNISSVASNHNLAFDATGRATLAISYPDAGQVTLTANDTAPTGAVMTGSGSFVAVPSRFEFSNVTAGPIRAGNNFSARITAQTGVGTACPTRMTAANFGNETPAQTATLSFSKCQPAGANSSNGTFSGSAAFANGVADVSNLNWSEVGNGDLVAANTGYLGSALNITGTTGTGGVACNGGGAGNVGAFVPDHFDVTVTDGCTGCGFTYSGQPFSVTITARNGLPVPTTTQNYDGTINTTPNFAHIVSLSDANAAATPAGQFSVSAVPLGVTVNPAGTILSVPASAFVSGVANLDAVPVYIFNTATTSPLILRMRAVDTINTSVTSSGYVEGTTQIRSGRFKVGNAYGSELLPLAVPVTAQYYQDATNGWVTSTTDSNTVFNSALTPSGNVQATIVQGPLTMASVVMVGASTAALSGGVKNITLQAPGAGSSGAVDLSILAPSYMLSGNNTAGVNPSVTGRATFGIYSGNGKYIYQRENY